MGKEGSHTIVHECQLKCTSKQHASNLIAALTQDYLSDEKVAAYLKWCCVRYPKAVDSNGRTLLHMAASKGRLKLLKFLLKHKDININEKDMENHFTALHRSLFYGQIHCAVRLIQLGANTELLDLDDFTPLDHVMRDLPKSNKWIEDLPHEVYVWGTNTNYTLGIGHHQSRANPEPLDMFRRQKIGIKNVAMSKYHSAFITTDGRLYTCGYGQGGRLGFEDEGAILTPKLLKVATSSECRFVALGTDHTILLMANKSVWSFGLNTYHQLGHDPPPPKITMPKAIKALKNADIIGICASKYHSVFWSNNQLYTCGLNGGQLGHIKEAGTTIPVPKAVTCFNLKKSIIKSVSSSDGATVLTTSSGEIYLFHEYRCKRIMIRPYDPKIVRAIGGHLDHKLNVGHLQENGGDELKLLIVTFCNTICLWEESTGEYIKCEICFRRRKLQIADICFGGSAVLMTTVDGKAYQGNLLSIKRKVPERKSYKLAKEYIKLERVPHIHRALAMSADFKGRNFAVVQFHPKSKLLQIPRPDKDELTHHMKILHSTLEHCNNFEDVIFEVEGRKFTAHRYIVAHSSTVLEEMMKNGIESDGIITVKLEDIRMQIFHFMLCYIYTRDFGLILPHLQPSRYECNVNAAEDASEEVNEETISAFEYNAKKNDGTEKKVVKPKEKYEPYKLLLNAAIRFEMWELKRELDRLGSADGFIERRKICTHKMPFKFNRENFPYLSDVTLKSNDGVEFKAHKCILVSRLEYFNCMINRGWREATQKTAISLPVAGKIMRIFIDYLYTGHATAVLSSDDPNLAFTVLIVADQFFCTGLRKFAEYALANFMTLKNAAETLQMGVTYNAEGLKNCAMEFICLNLPAVLELRSLQVLSDEVLKELTDYYRLHVPWIYVRYIPAYHNAPDEKLVDLISSTEPVSLETVDENLPTTVTPVKTKKAPRAKRNNRSDKKRNVSGSSVTSEDEIENLQVVNPTDQNSESSPDNFKLPNIQQTMRIPIKPAFLQQALQDSQLNLYGDPSFRAKAIQNLELNFQWLSMLEREFPSLDARNPNSNPPSPKENENDENKFVKLSPHLLEHLVSQTSNEREEAQNEPENTPRPAWAAASGNDSEPQSLSDIMEEENRASTSQNSSSAASPPWQNTPIPESNLSDVMASELRERELVARMRSKPLVCTQMEDKAMEELLLLYNASDATDERITVRRAEYEFHNPPVWVSNRK